MLKGMVDVDKEVSKLTDNISKLDGQLAKLMKAMTIEGYEEKVSECSEMQNSIIHIPFCTGAS